MCSTVDRNQNERAHASTYPKHVRSGHMGWSIAAKWQTRAWSRTSHVLWTAARTFKYWLTCLVHGHTNRMLHALSISLPLIRVVPRYLGLIGCTINMILPLNQLSKCVRYNVWRVSVGIHSQHARIFIRSFHSYTPIRQTSLRNDWTATTLYQLARMAIAFSHVPFKWKAYEQIGKQFDWQKSHHDDDDDEDQMSTMARLACDSWMEIMFMHANVHGATCCRTIFMLIPS